MIGMKMGSEGENDERVREIRNREWRKKNHGFSEHAGKD